MRQFVDAATEFLLAFLGQRGIDVPESAVPFVQAQFVFAAVGVIVTAAAIYAGLFIYFERRIGARIMSRIGPNRVGPQGILQWLADAVKLIIKEDIIPDAADKPLFKLAPYLMAMGVFTGFAVLPLSYHLVASDLNVGVLYLMAVTSISVVGILMSGWASNSKWALFGGMRSAAQIISYEIPTAVAVMPAVMLAGTMSTQGIIAAQGGAHGGAPYNWFVFHSPMMFVLFIVSFVAGLAEGSRTPFDLPEAESELVSGYNTEYSGFRFAAYFLAEFANTWILAAIQVVVFLGGWQIPWVSMETVQAATGGMAVLYELLGVGVFVLKTMVLIFVIVQLRWTLPRVRVDQMMTVCWKYLVPVVFVCSILMMLWMIVAPWNSPLGEGIRYVMTAVGIGILVLYTNRVRYNLKSAKAKAYFKVAV